MSHDGHKIESIYAFGKIPASSDALIASIRNWVTGTEQSKWPRGLQYFENVSYLLGNHLTKFYYNDGGFGFHRFGVTDKNPFDSLVAKSADNRLVRPTENVVSMLTSSQPMPRVEPNSDLVEDEDAAELSEIVLTLLWEKPLDMKRKLREAAMIGCVAGTAIAEIEYTEVDQPVVIPNTKIEIQENGAQEEVLTGGDHVEKRRDITCRMWTPFHITPDPAATTPEEAVWFIRTTFEDIDWIKENYNKPGKNYFTENLENISAGNMTNVVLFWWAKVQEIIESPQYYQHGGGLTGQTMAQQGGYAPNQTIFRVIDVKPTSEFPRGRTLVTAGDQLIYAGDARSFIAHDEDENRWKYPWRWHPYAFWGWMKPPGRFWHLPLLSEIVPLQKRINAIDALVHANRSFMALGQWMTPKHCKIPEGRMSGTPGEGFQYTDIPGHRAPELVNHKPLPQELIQEREIHTNSIEIIAASGITDPAVSKSAARSGVMLDFMRQEKLRPKNPMIQEWEQFIETIAANVLIEVQAGLVNEDQELTERVIKAARENSGFSITNFIGASLRDHHAVKIDVASEVLKSPEARSAKASEYFQYASNNQFLSPNEKEGIQKAMGLDEFVKTAESASLKRARRLVSRVVNGQVEDLAPERLESLIMEGVDKPAVMAPVFQNALLSEKRVDYPPEVQEALFGLFDVTSRMAAKEAAAAQKQQIAQAIQMAKIEALSKGKTAE